MKLLVADKLDEAAIAKMRDAGLDVTVKTGLAPEALLAEIPSYDVIAIRSATKVTKAVITAGKNLKLIVRAGIGLDNVDLVAAKVRGIPVHNTPAATTISVAEHTMALLLALVRNIPAAHAKLEQGVWEKTAFMGQELSDKTLGLIGIGRIGREVAKRAKAFGMNVIATDPLVDFKTAQAEGIELVKLDDLLTQADVVSLHLPLGDDTRNLLNEKRIAQMKKGSYLINCARGGIVDEKAVANAVLSGDLKGAAFDVFAEEPLPETSPLLGVPGIIVTPHLGAQTYEGQRRAGLELAEMVIQFSTAP